MVNMTDQITQLVPIEADEVDGVQPQAKPTRERLNLRMEINELLPKVVTRTSKVAIASLVLGALVFWTLGLTAIPAVITGHIGLLITRRAQRGRWMAIVGLVLGYATLVVFGLVILGGLLYMVES